MVANTTSVSHLSQNLLQKKSNALSENSDRIYFSFSMAQNINIA